MRTIYIILSCFLFLFQSISFPQQNVLNEKLDAFIENVREELKLKTGLSISVVKEGKVYFSKAYGYADAEKEITADINTPFYIASSTKSFLGTLAKILSDEGVMNLDSPISLYLPELKLQPPLNPDIITVRDLLTHRSGIESFAVILRTAFTGQQTDEKILELFGSAEFTKREFRYTNTDYVLVSLIIKKVTGRGWKELMKDKIFSPLGMDKTSAIVSSYKPGLLPAGYKSVDGEAVPYSFTKTDESMHAAGGIYSSADDLSRWLIFNLGDGTFNGKRILSEHSLDEIHSAQINYSQTFFTYNRFAYGLGWIRSDYKGKLLIHHFGSYSGARSHISFMPEEQTGVAVLVNDDGDAFYIVDLIADYVYNLLDENVNADSIGSAELKMVLEKLDKKEEQKDGDEQKQKMNIDFSLYTGKYLSDDYGEVVLSKKDEQLFIDWGNLKGSLSPESREKFSAMLGAFYTKIEFTAGENENTFNGLIVYGPVKMIFMKVN